MKDVIISHKSALQLTRMFRVNKDTKDILDWIQNGSHSNSSFLSTRIDVLVTSQNFKHKSKKFNFHVYKNELPKNSIIRLNNIYVVCPELLLIQLARLLPFEILWLIALEFCGSYSMTDDINKFKSDLAPITTPDNISNYVDKLSSINKNTWGIAKMKQMCPLLEKNSASPMESRLFAKLCGPRKLGLYGCKNLKFNVPAKASAEALQIAGQRQIIPDLSCAKKRVAIEYNSTQYHESSIQGQKDQRRRDALVHDGWKVFSFTPEQVYNAKTFYIIARKILEALDQNSRIRNKYFFENNKQAFEILR